MHAQNSEEATKAYILSSLLFQHLLQTSLMSSETVLYPGLGLPLHPSHAALLHIGGVSAV